MENTSPQENPSNAFSLYITNWKGFIDKYLKSGKPPYFLYICYLIGLGQTLSKLDDKVGTAFYRDFTWVQITPFIMLIALWFSLLFYWLGGYFFHLGVRLSGGNRDFRTSRYIMTYAAIPAALFSILYGIANAIILGDTYFTAGADETVAMPAGLIAIIIFVYSFYLLYTGVRHGQQTRKIPTILVFIVLPLLLAASLLVTLLSK